MVKRFFDIIFSLLLLIVLSPLMLIVAIIVAFKFKENPFFLSKRSGRFGKSFTIFKFKSMATLVNKSGVLLSDEERITYFGKLLRASSIDELPQLVNVLMGQMSLVGPRPLNESFLSEYSSEQRKRLNVRPGITGWAQVNGRNSISWEKKFQLDNFYVQHHSLYLDLKIIVLTVFKVFIREGISQDGFVNASDFKRKNSEA